MRPLLLGALAALLLGGVAQAAPTVEVGDTVAYTCGGGSVVTGARRPVEVSARVTAVLSDGRLDLALERAARTHRACRTTRPRNVPFNADPSVGHTWRP